MKRSKFWLTTFQTALGALIGGSVPELMTTEQAAEKRAQLVRSARLYADEAQSHLENIGEL